MLTTLREDRCSLSGEGGESVGSLSARISQRRLTSGLFWKLSKPAKNIESDPEVAGSTLSASGSLCIAVYGHRSGIGKDQREGMAIRRLFDTESNNGAIGDLAAEAPQPRHVFTDKRCRLQHSNASSQTERDRVVMVRFDLRKKAFFVAGVE